MGIALHKETVFVGAWFGFVAVDNEIARPDVLGSKAPLDTCGETSAATTKKSCSLDLACYSFRAHRERLAQCLIAAGCFETGKRKAVGIIET